MHVWCVPIRWAHTVWFQIDERFPEGFGKMRCAGAVHGWRAGALALGRAGAGTEEREHEREL